MYVFQRRRPGGSAGKGIPADLLLPGEVAETFTGDGCGIPTPALCAAVLRDSACALAG